MEAPKYWVMVVARVIQGISSSMVWVAGLALMLVASLAGHFRLLMCSPVATLLRKPLLVVGVSDCVDMSNESKPSLPIGQLGIAVIGTSLGYDAHSTRLCNADMSHSILLGPPSGGALYTRAGFRGPFIISITATAADLIARLLIIERKQAIRHGYDPAAPSAPPEELERPSVLHIIAGGPDKTLEPSGSPEDHKDAEMHTSVAGATTPAEDVKSLSLPAALRVLLKSSRALTVTYNTLIYGYVFIASYVLNQPPISIHRLISAWLLPPLSLPYHCICKHDGVSTRLKLD